MADKLVTVFMPVFNRELYVAEAIQSVLNQTFQDFELLIINDGSTDGTVNVISQFSDPRIRLLHNPHNLGQPDTRNRGLNEASTEFIALHDSDDLMAPTRLEKQLNFLVKKKDIIAVGSRCNYINTKSERIGKGRNFPTNPEDLRIGFLFYQPVMHGTLMGRLNLLRDYTYDRTLTTCEDYDLFSRINFAHKFANLHHRLIDVRKHNNRNSETHKNIGESIRLNIIEKQLKRLGVEITNENLKFHRRLQYPKKEQLLNEHFLSWAEFWLQDLLRSNDLLDIYNRPAFIKYISNIWMRLLVKSIKHRGLKSVSKLFYSPLTRYCISSRLARNAK